MGDRKVTTRRVSLAEGGEAARGRRGVLLALTGARPGLVVPIGDKGLVVGRDPELATLVMDDDSLSRRHARFFPMHGHYVVEDLGSTNGTLLNGTRVTDPTPLRDGVRVQVGLSTLLRFMLQDEQEFEGARSLYDSSVRDALTGLYNRHFLDERLRGEVAYAVRHRTPLSVLFVDADHFKRINDTHGHGVGDEVLRALGRFLAKAVRVEDLVARIGGEEFVVVLRGIGRGPLHIVGERVRAGVEALPVDAAGTPLNVTVSVGGATLDEVSELGSPAALLAVADGALYAAKRAGRNQVVIARASTLPPRGMSPGATPPEGSQEG